jgi:hypothetical protein
MPLPFTPRQIDENRRFLSALGETGNVRLSARSIGRAYSTMQHRRSASAAFAQDWEAALAAAHARFHLGGGRRGPEAERGTVAAGRRRGRLPVTVPVKKALSPAAVQPAPPPGFTRFPSSKLGEELGAGERKGLRTRGGEAVVVRTRAGTLQLRLAHPGKLTKAAEQAFLAALSASANVRLSAAAAGASPAAFYRRRKRDAAFAREFRIALGMGYERLQLAAIRSALPESGEHDAWRSNEPPPIPPLTADQALQLLCHHRKSVELGWDLPHRRRRRGEPWETYTERLSAMWRSERERAAEDEAVARALRFEATGSWRREDEAEPPPLPPLHLVTGWSRASGRAPHHEGVALFGGWRIADMERKLGRRR